MIVRVYPGENGATKTTTLYQDDGETRAYLRGQSEQTELSYFQTDSQGILSISAAQGKFAGQPQSRTHCVPIRRLRRTSSRLGRSAQVPVNFDAGANINDVVIPEKSLNQSVIVRIQWP